MKNVRSFEAHIDITVDDAAGVSFPSAADLELIISGGLTNVLVKQNGGIDHAMIAVEVDAQERGQDEVG